MGRTGLLGLFVVLAASGAMATNTPSMARQVPATSHHYDEFIKLSADERHARFVAMKPEHKAAMVRTHIERWLRTNRGRLTPSEVRVFEEMIAFVTPDLYRERRDDTLDRREEALGAKMRCRVDPEDVLEATNLLRGGSQSPPSKRRWTYLTQAKCWFNWVLEGVVDYVPGTPR